MLSYAQCLSVWVSLCLTPTRSAYLKWDEAALGGMQARRGSHEAAGPREAEEGEGGAPPQGASLLRAVTGGFAQEAGALREGMAYITAPENRRALLTGNAQIRRLWERSDCKAVQVSM